MSARRIGVCPLCGDIVDVLKDGRCKSHYPSDLTFAYNGRPGYFCRVGNLLALPCGDMKRTTISIVWLPNVSHEDALEETRAWTNAISKQKGVERCRHRSVISRNQVEPVSSSGS